MKRFFFTSVLYLLTLIVVSFNAQAQNEFVDLGLSVTWATCNVGANSPEENGEYYTFDNALALENNGERLPTKEEFQELIDNCTWLWREEGVHGYMATSKKNGNSIFLPAATSRPRASLPAATWPPSRPPAAASRSWKAPWAATSASRAAWTQPATGPAPWTCTT